MILYKLTDPDYRTYNNTLWGEGVTHKVRTKQKNPDLCSGDVIHAYKGVSLGLLLNPIHGDIRDPVLWEAEGEVVAEDWGKVGCFELTTVRIIQLPRWYRDRKIRRKVQSMLAILCAEAVLKYFEDKYPDDDRPRKAIQAAKEYLQNPRRAYSAALRAESAASAAESAAWAAAAESAAERAALRAARAAAWAALSAASAVESAARAAESAASAAESAASAVESAEPLDFVKIADEAVRIILTGDLT